MTNNREYHRHKLPLKYVFASSVLNDLFCMLHNYLEMIRIVVYVLPLSVLAVFLVI